MTRREPTDLAASVRHCLLDISRRTKTDANLIWTRYAVERLLFRLASSEHAREFVLKGAMLFTVWTRQPYRPTLDLDLLGFGEDWLAKIERWASQPTSRNRTETTDSESPSGGGSS